MKITFIGGGPGGYEAAIYAAKCGAQVVLVEKGEVGGTCLNRGCIPTKALLASAEALHTAQKAADFGLQAENVQADFAAVIARKDKIVDTLRKGIERTLAANGVTVLHGTGKLAPDGGVAVALHAGGEEKIASDAVVLATGSVASVPSFIPLDGETILTSDDVLALEKAPASIVIAGGGVIGCELGQFLARMGTAVTIVEMQSHLLPLEDEDTAKALERQFRREKIKFVCGSAITKVEKTPDGVQVSLANDTCIMAEKMLVSIGRKPYTKGLGLAEAGVDCGAAGHIEVDETMKTSRGGVYAVGDLVATPQLAHVATKEGFVAVDNILGKANTMHYHAVPRCVYTRPEVAAVGMTETELAQNDIPCKTGRFDLIALGKAKAASATEGFVKVLVNEKDVLVGAALVGAHATEMLTLLTLAIDKGMTAAEVGDVIFPHPTMSEGVMEALHDVHGKSIHKV